MTTAIETISNRGMLARGQRGKLRFSARWDQDTRKRSTCRTCGGGVHRSWRTGILHRDCFGCRYLRMIYGPNIKVTRTKEKEEREP